MGNLYKALLSHKSRKFDLQIQQIVSKPAIEHNMWRLVLSTGRQQSWNHFPVKAKASNSEHLGQTKKA